VKWCWGADKKGKQQMPETITGPVEVNQQAVDDPSSYAFVVRATKGAVGQLAGIMDETGAPILTVGATGGPAVWGDRLGASPGLFRDELAIDGGISIPALVFLTGANLGNYTTAPHYWIGQVGDPGTTLANLKNNLGNYIACQPGDRYSRIDTPTVADQREYICIAAGTAAAGETAGTWEPMS
jgi:hypothetical protein